MKSKRKIGIIFGKFYPLHCGHIYLIEKAITQVDELHVFLGCEQTRDLKLFEISQMTRQPLVKDRFYWLKKTFQNYRNIYIHVLDETGIAYYPDGWKDWSDRVKLILAKHHVKPTVIFTSERQDMENHQRYFKCAVELVDVNRDFMNISATKIRNNPFHYWQYIARAARPFFVLKIALVSKSNKFDHLANQLANIYNTVYINNGYINYLHHEHAQDLSLPLNDIDYMRIAMLQAQRIDDAAINANKLLFTSFDFDTLHHYYQKSFHKENPFLKELIDKYPFDIVIKSQDLDSSESQLLIFESILNQVKAKLN